MPSLVNFLSPAPAYNSHSAFLAGLNASLAQSAGEFWLNKELPLLGKSYCLCFCPDLGFLAMRFDTQALDTQARAQNTRIIAQIPQKSDEKTCSIESGPKAKWCEPKSLKLPYLWRHPQTKSEIYQIFKI